MPDWITKVLASIVAAAAVGSFGWAWQLNTEIAVVQRDVEEAVLAGVQAREHDAAIQVIETKLTYIEEGIARIERALSDRR